MPLPSAPTPAGVARPLQACWLCSSSAFHRDRHAVVRGHVSLQAMEARRRSGCRTPKYDSVVTIRLLVGLLGVDREGLPAWPSGVGVLGAVARSDGVLMTEVLVLRHENSVLRLGRWLACATSPRIAPGSPRCPR